MQVNQMVTTASYHQSSSHLDNNRSDNNNDDDDVEHLGWKTSGLMKGSRKRCATLSNNGPPLKLARIGKEQCRGLKKVDGDDESKKDDEDEEEERLDDEDREMSGEPQDDLVEEKGNKERNDQVQPPVEQAPAEETILGDIFENGCALDDDENNSKENISYHSNSCKENVPMHVDKDNLRKSRANADDANGLLQSLANGHNDDDFPMSPDNITSPDGYFWRNEFSKPVKRLGKGGFGFVMLCKHTTSGQLVALKSGTHNGNRNQWAYDLLREGGIHRRLCHPNVLQCHGLIDEFRPWIVMELATGNLEELRDGRRKNGNPFTACEVAQFLSDIASGLRHCHSKRVIHRDIKLRNLMIGTRSGAIKIGDFGTSCYFESPKQLPRHTLCGTIEYVAPEMLSETGHDMNVDIWAVGVVLHNLLSATDLFQECDRHRIMEYDFHLHNDVPEMAKELISQLMAKDPNKRYPLRNILQHPWVVVSLNEGP